MDVGALPDGEPYMVMECLEGRDLAALLRSTGPLSIDDTVDYVLQASEAIADAHRLGIVHRDLKPSNLFLVESHGVGRGVIKVLDFGISKVTGLGGQGSMTQSVSMLGSPAYMSPEQMDSARDVDARTDIWALGVILYELLSGVPPFTGDSLPQLCMAISSRPAAPLRRARPDVPVGLEQVVARCLEKDRTIRLGSVVELALALREFAPPRSHLSIERIHAMAARSGSGPITPLPVASRAEPRLETLAAEPPTGSTHPGWGNTAGKQRPPLRRALVTAAVAAVVLVGAAFLVPGLVAPTETSPTAQGSNPPPAVRPPPVPAAELSATSTAAQERLAETPSASAAPNPTATSIASATLSARPLRPAPAPPGSTRRPAPVKPRPQDSTWEDER